MFEEFNPVAGGIAAIVGIMALISVRLDGLGWETVPLYIRILIPLLGTIVAYAVVEYQTQ